MADNQSLYPVFEIPTMATETTSRDAQMEFRPAPLFDYEKGDFVRDGANHVIMVDGREAYMNWAQKVIMTQYGAALSYMTVGIDADGAMQAPTHAATESILERSITETLLANPCTERVYDFSFEWNADSMMVHFIIQPMAWAAFDIEQMIV